MHIRGKEMEKIAGINVSATVVTDSDPTRIEFIIFDEDHYQKAKELLKCIEEKDLVKKLKITAMMSRRR